MKTASVNRTGMFYIVGGSPGLSAGRKMLELAYILFKYKTNSNPDYEKEKGTVINKVIL